MSSNYIIDTNALLLSHALSTLHDGWRLHSVSFVLFD